MYNLHKFCFTAARRRNVFTNIRKVAVVWSVIVSAKQNTEYHQRIFYSIINTRETIPWTLNNMDFAPLVSLLASSLSLLIKSWITWVIALNFSKGFGKLWHMYCWTKSTEWYHEKNCLIYWFLSWKLSLIIKGTNTNILWL